MASSQQNHATANMNMTSTKTQPAHVEEYADDDMSKDPNHIGDGHLTLPASLQNLSEQEYNALGRQAMRKLDLWIMPILIIMYILNYLDRQNIASARLANLPRDLKLSTTQYQTCVSILFCGYILMQVPSNMIISKVKLPGVYICVAMAVWGIVSACMGAVTSFGGLLACRFILGVIEAAFFPGALFYLSLFYNRKQFALRTALLYAGSQLGNAFGGLFAIAILKLEGAHGIQGWRWLFIVEGAITVGLAIVFGFLLPNDPKTMRGLTVAQRDWISYNYEQDQGQEDNSNEITAVQGLMLAIKDPKTWMLMGILYCCYIDGAVSNFFPSVVGTLGYSRTITYCLTAPPYLLCVVVMLINGWHSDKKQERYLHIIIPMGVTVIAMVIAVSTTKTAARYLAMCLMPTSFYSAAIVILSWITGSIPQPKVKRAVAISLINAVCNTPNIWTSYLYTGAPRYTVAFSVNVVAAFVSILFATATRFYLARQNRKMDQGLSVSKSGPTAKQQAAGFRYTL